jgi:peptidase E
MALPEMETLLREAALAYIPGGNWNLLNHRLHLCKLADYLRKAVAAGPPLVAFGAGTVLCGPNILTSNDPNIVPTSYFRGLEPRPSTSTFITRMTNPSRPREMSGWRSISSFMTIPSS